MQTAEPQIVHEQQRAEYAHARAARTNVEDVHPVSELPPLVPGELLLGTLADPRLRLVLPVRARLFFEHDHVVAEATELNEFGFGSNFSEAVRDLQRAVAQLYFSLEESAERLGADLHSTWSVLQHMVVKTEQHA